MASKDDIIARMGLDTSDFEKSLASVESKTNAATSATNKLSGSLDNVGKSAKQGGYRMGQLSLQAQDVAVQLQSGTKLATIIAQQGSQMASAFGPAGMVAGGLIAIGGLLYQTGEVANTTFENMVKGANDFHDATQAIISSGSLGGMIGQFAEAKKKADELQKQKDNLSQFGSAMGWLQGGPSHIERMRAANEAMTKAAQDQRDLANAALSISEKDVEIARMKAAGLTEQVEIIQRARDLEKEIVAIRTKGLEPEVENKLVNDLKERFRIEDEAKRNKKAAEEEKKLREFERKQKEQFQKFEEDRIKKIASEEKKASDEIKRANDDMVSAQEQGQKAQDDKLSIASRLAIANRKVADAEKQVAKETKGTLGWYKEMAKLQQSRNDASELFAQRASNYGTSFAQGRRADREQEKEVKRQQRGERRLREAEARKASTVRGAASGLGDQQVRGGNIQPRGPNAPALAPEAGKEMNVAVLNVGTLKPK